MKSLNKTDLKKQNKSKKCVEKYCHITIGQCYEEDKGQV